MLIVTLLAFLSICDGYRVLLFFPIPGKSHSILGEAYIRHLVNAGHEVTYITPIPIKTPPARVRQVDISETAGLLSEELFNIEKLMYKELDLQQISLFEVVLRNFLNGTLHGKAMHKFLHDPKEEYDVVIVEWLYSELGSGLSTVFNCPLIWSTSTEVHSGIISLIGDDLNPSYAINIWDRDFSSPLYRFKNLWTYLENKYNKWTYVEPENLIFEQAYRTAVELRGRRLPSFDEVRFNASIMLGNSHIAAGESYPLPQAYKMIGGYHLKGVMEPLPKDLQKIMDEAKDGVIYFSLGTMLRSSALPEAKKRELLTAFSKLKQTVVWKHETPMSNVPKNVHVLQWAPQQSILAHPNTILFITHGGLLSLYELLDVGVPLIGIPMFGDQFTNINRAVLKGFAKRFDIGEQPVSQLVEYIKEMIENPLYRQRAKEMSLVFHSHVVPPGQELVHWVEHVIKTRGAPHFRSVSMRLHFYQKYYLDLLTFILLLLSTIVYVAIKILKRKTPVDLKKHE
ncbi:unnamed protein product [Leptosia nina]|uniref:UDP-glucuronosyltransferase n=1 Tax=Leptosia nina TaxID=320188 RepID=A0AAV1JBT0_9NEOP